MFCIEWDNLFIFVVACVFLLYLQKFGCLLSFFVLYQLIKIQNLHRDQDVYLSNIEVQISLKMFFFISIFKIKLDVNNEKMTYSIFA